MMYEHRSEGWPQSGHPTYRYDDDLVRTSSRRTFSEDWYVRWIITMTRCYRAGRGRWSTEVYPRRRRCGGKVRARGCIIIDNILRGAEITTRNAAGRYITSSKTVSQNNGGGNETGEKREEEKEKNSNIDLCVLRASLKTGADAGAMPQLWYMGRKNKNIHSAGKETGFFSYILFYFLFFHCCLFIRMQCA